MWHFLIHNALGNDSVNIGEGKERAKWRLEWIEHLLCGPSPVLAFDISDFMETTLGGPFNHYPNLGLKKSKSGKILGDLIELQHSCW